MKEILAKAREIAEVIRREGFVKIVTHIDADGITSGAIAFESLRRAGIDCEIEFLKKLDVDVIGDEFVWFTDLGSSCIREIVRSGLRCVITDHHVPDGYYKNQLNPHDFGYDGSYDLSGSGATYLVSKFLNPVNHTDLIQLAIVGAVGDLQDSRECKLVGLNEALVNEGVTYGFLDVERDLRFFGKQTRPVFKMLEYNFDPYIPGVSGSERGSIDLLKRLGIPLKFEDWRRWIDLEIDERRAIVSELVRICIRNKYPIGYIGRLVGECYILKKQAEGTELRDATELSTLLNATARYNKAEIGLKVCLGILDGDLDWAFRKARRLLQMHRRNLSEGIKLALSRMEELENIQFFHARDEIIDTIVGIVAGMCYSRVNLEKPIVAFANCDEGVKVSARATQRLVDGGVDLEKAIRLACERVGGSGGGHKIAAGAVIPRGKENEFLEEFNRIIGEQIRNGAGGI
ncbi:MAG: recombinase RecJ [Archaeoglobales archaeon]|nr:MAG: recombinase RecJ [Archaeoglobales archaeon]